MVLKLSARMQRHVTIHDLQITGFKPHFVGDIRAPNDLIKLLKGCKVLSTDLWGTFDFLGTAHAVPVPAAEPFFALLRKHWLHHVRPLVGCALALPAKCNRLVQPFQLIGIFTCHHIVASHRAANNGLTTRNGLIKAA